MKTWWLCYHCDQYHSMEGCPSWIDNKRSISYDDSLCELWATGLAFPLVTKKDKTLTEKKDGDGHDA